MSNSVRVGLAFMTGAMLVPFFGAEACAQNHAPNPYNTVGGVWAPLPDDREWGATSAVEVSPDGETIWAIDRCGANTCDPQANGYVDGAETWDVVFQFDKDGNILRQWGAGMFVWPHGIDVDDEGNVWVADARGSQAGDKGHQVIKFSPDGEVLLRLGTAGVAGRTESTFDAPNDVLVAPNGDIFVGDGHSASGNNRIVKFSSDGTYLMEWGETGSEPGQFRTPHALAMDSQGLLYVGDRSNRRVQVFEQDGTFVRDFYNWGRASGLAIDSEDRIYIADSESSAGSNPGYLRGIRVADPSTGFTLAFIPDPEGAEATGTTAAEGVAVDNDGNVYGAEVGPRALRKHILSDGHEW